MHRFFVSPDSIQIGVIHFNTAHAHQLRDVLRMSANDTVIVLDNTGSEYRVVLQELTRASVAGKILDRRAAVGEPRTQIILHQALLKADKFEWVLQKGTELGIAAFSPIVSERSVQDAGKNKFARWTQIVTEAAEQAGRGKIPPLHVHQSLARALELAKLEGAVSLMPWEHEKTRDLKMALDAADTKLIHLFIGPEGGFAENEIVQARNQGAQVITLGPRILRAETAGLVAASAILYARGDLSRA
jgi:16S rRNA (uracil1498-N3)-methyltransferase